MQVERARSELAERAAKLSAESESITLQLEEAELRASAAIKSATTMETQLSEAQAQLEEETRQKLALSSRLRQVESEMETIREQLEEEGDAKKKLESQVSWFCSILQALLYCVPGYSREPLHSAFCASKYLINYGSETPI